MSLVLLYLAVEVGVAYLLVEELGDEVVKPSLLLDPLLIIPRSGVDVISRDEFEVIHLLEQDFGDGFFIRQVQVLAMKEWAYGI